MNTTSTSPAGWPSTVTVPSTAANSRPPPHPDTRAAARATAAAQVSLRMVIPPVRGRGGSVGRRHFPAGPRDQGPQGEQGQVVPQEPDAAVAEEDVVPTGVVAGVVHHSLHHHLEPDR